MQIKSFSSPRPSFSRVELFTAALFLEELCLRPHSAACRLLLISFSCCTIFLLKVEFFVFLQKELIFLFVVNKYLFVLWVRTWGILEIILFFALNKDYHIKKIQIPSRVCISLYSMSWSDSRPKIIIKVSGQSDEIQWTESSNNSHTQFHADKSSSGTKLWKWNNFPASFDYETLLLLAQHEICCLYTHFTIPAYEVKHTRSAIPAIINSIYLFYLLRSMERGEE